MSEFWTKNKGKIVAVSGAVFLALGGYLTGTVDLVHAVTSVVTAIAN
jgi:hypothetical protein